MKWETGMHYILFILLFLYVAIPQTLVQSQGNDPHIIILYSSQQERDVVEEIVTTNFPNVINSSVSITNFNETVLNNQDILIFLSQTNFTLSTGNQSSIVDFVTQDKKSLVAFSPYVSQFNSSLLSQFGVANYNKTYPTALIPEIWELQLNKTLGNLNEGFNTTYQGQFGVFDKFESTETIVYVNDTPSVDLEIQQLTFPLPAIINSSTAEKQIIFGSISAIPLSFGGLGLNQIPIFEDLISEVISNVIDYHSLINQPVASNTDTSPSPTTSDTETSTTTPTSETTTPGQEDQDGQDFDPNPFLFIALLMTFIIAFRNQIRGILRWLEEALVGVIVAIANSLYKPQNRFLETSQVLINQNRARIISYLEFLKGSGAHFREIKGVMKLGTGILMWHLQVLEEFGLITKYKIGRYKIYVAYDFDEEFDIEEKKVEIKFRSKYSKVIFENLMSIEGDDKFNVTELANRSSVDRKTTRKHLELLNQENIIELEKTPSGVEIIKINKVRIEKLLKRIELKESYYESN